MIDIDAEPKRCHQVPFLREFGADQAAPASARLPGLTAGIAASSGRQRVGRVGWDVERRQRHTLDADVRLAARSVDEAGGADDRSRMLGQRGDRLARGEAGGDDVLDHQHARARSNRETAAQLEDAALALDEDRLGAEPARRLVARNDAAERGRSDDVDRLRTLRGPFSASARQRRSVRAGSWNTNIFCKKDRRVQPGRQTKWPVSRAPAARNSSSA